MKSWRLIRPLLDAVVPLQVEYSVLVAFAVAKVLDFWVEDIPDEDEPVMPCACQEVATVAELGAEDVSLVSLELHIGGHQL